MGLKRYNPPPVATQISPLVETATEVADESEAKVFQEVCAKREEEKNVASNASQESLNISKVQLCFCN